MMNHLRAHSAPDQKPLNFAYDPYQSTYVADFLLRDASIKDVSVNFTKTETVQTRTGIHRYTLTNPQMTMEQSNSSKMPSIFSHLSTFLQLHRKHSIYGPTTTQRMTFGLIICSMTVCGMSSPFLTKTAYQTLDFTNNVYNVLWFGWIFTLGCEGICTFAVIFGWEHGEQWQKAKSEWKPFWFNTVMSGTLGVYQNGGKYISLIFLPVSVAIIIKNGSQLLFSALFRKCIERKTLSFMQTVGIFIVTVGLTCVCGASIMSDNETTLQSNIIGITLLLSAALCGAVRNHYEQILCRDMQYNAHFVVGMRGIPAFFWLAFVGLLLFSLDIDTANNFFVSAFNINGFIICFCLFLLTVYGKNVSQMKVIELSSALTRNLTMQFMPFGTWIMSLMIHSIYNNEYGESWNKFSVLQLAGFLIVLFGSICYMKRTVLTHQKVPRRVSNVMAGSIQTTNLYPEMMYTRGSVSTTSYEPYAFEEL